MDALLKPFVTALPDAPTLSDYTQSDGFTDAQEPQCPHCEVHLRSDHRDDQSVVDQHGDTYSSINGPTPDDGPFFCLPCWAELETNRLAHNTHDGRDTRD